MCFRFWMIKFLRDHLAHRVNFDPNPIPGMKRHMLKSPKELCRSILVYRLGREISADPCQPPGVKIILVASHGMSSLSLSLRLCLWTSCQSVSPRRLLRPWHLLIPADPSPSTRLQLSLYSRREDSLKPTSTAN
jgi:hypothetical protein